jgi:hypothetical protein
LGSKVNTWHAGNFVVGPLPKEWAALTRVTDLNLSNNKLTGGLPNNWYGLLQARIINLSSNLLTSVLPRNLGEMADRTTHQLQQIILSDNPCMNPTALQRSIAASGILKGGWVQVDTACCSAALQQNKMLCLN